tara:strand:- start:2626 stop:3231 length:606 start_codon:yes stop_codon:yes gene_type:complete
MKISIDNKGKKEKFTLISSWDDVTVEKYARLVKYNDLSGSQKSLHTLGLFTDIPKHLIKQIDVVSLGQILSIINGLQREDASIYRHTFKHEGTEYGIIPDLSAITLGEYADLETFMTRGVMDNLCEIAAVLFRPISSRTDKSYSIEPYELASSKDRAIKFKTLSASQVQGALVFFWNLGTLLLASSGLFSDQIVQEMKKSK